MSLLHLVHKTVAIKFSDCAKSQFNPEAAYAFRLTGVDGMGFLQLQGLKPGEENDGEPYWINKDLVRELHEIDPATTKLALTYTGKAEKAHAAEPIDPVQREMAPKLPKAKAPKKTALKQKPIFT